MIDSWVDVAFQKPLNFLLKALDPSADSPLGSVLRLHGEGCQGDCLGLLLPGWAITPGVSGTVALLTVRPTPFFFFFLNLKGGWTLRALSM